MGTGPAQPTRRVALARNAGHLFALCGLAFGQPVFNLLEGDPSSLIIEGVTGTTLLLLVVMVLLVPPALLMAVESAASLAGPGALKVAHLAIVGVLAALFVYQARTSLGVLPDGTEALSVVAVAVAGLCVLAYARVALVRNFVSVLALAPPVFAALFCLAGPASPLLTAADPPPAPSAVIPPDSPPVVMVIFDELPMLSLLDGRGRIDAERYPAFAELAAEGTWFRDVAAVDGSTPWAVPAILDGNYPRRRRVAAAGYHPRSIFALLGGRYRMHVKEVVTRVCPRRLCPRDDRRGLDGAWHAFGVLNSIIWDRLLPGKLAEGAARATARVREALGADDPDTINDKRLVGVREFVGAVTERRRDYHRWLSEIRASTRPTFHFMHALLPHGPWEFLPSGRRYKAEEPRQEKLRWVGDRTRMDTVWQAHILQTRYADRLLGMLLDRLKAEGVYERAVVVVTSDHGAAFHPGKAFRYPTRDISVELASVPFIVKASGRAAGRVVDTPLETIDELPTIADALGIELPWQVDGASGYGEVPREMTQIRMTTFGRPAEPFPRRRLLDQKALLNERIAVTGVGSDDGQLFAVRGYGDLVGDRMPERPGRDPAVQARLDDPAAWRDVDLRAPFVPAWMAGTLSGPGGHGRLVAIALNGRVAAVARTWRGSGEVERFTAIVSDETLRPGANDVALYLLRSGRRDLSGATRIG